MVAVFLLLGAPPAPRRLRSPNDTPTRLRPPSPEMIASESSLFLICSSLENLL